MKLYTFWVIDNVGELGEQSFESWTAAAEAVGQHRRLGHDVYFTRAEAVEYRDMFRSANETKG